MNMDKNKKRFLRRQRLFEISIGIILIALGVSQLLRSYAINNTIKQLVALNNANALKIHNAAMNVFILNMSVWFDFVIDVFMIILGIMLISDKVIHKLDI
jgi:hypothetical protein